MASGLINTSQQIGGALGLAILATVANSRTDDAVAAGKPAAVALTEGFQNAFLAGAGITIAGAILAICSSPAAPPASTPTPRSVASWSRSPRQPEPKWGLSLGCRGTVPTSCGAWPTSAGRADACGGGARSARDRGGGPDAGAGALARSCPPPLYYGRTSVL